MKRYCDLSPEQKRRAIARTIANAAQRMGKIVPKPCEVCGAEKAQKHHDDYSKPLLVRWLCRKCHDIEHDGFVARAAFGSGNCSRCPEPQAKGSRYCAAHRAEYQRNWRKKRTDEYRALKAGSMHGCP